MVDKVTPETQVMAYMAEYNALRDEIGWLLNGATQYQNFAIILVCAFLGFLAGTVASQYTIYVFLFAPLSISLLGFLYFRQHEEVYVIARYIDSEIAPRVRTVLGISDIFLWEQFKASRVSGVKPASRMINTLRLLLFLLPSLIALVVSAKLLNWGTFATFSLNAGWIGANSDVLLQAVMFAMAVVVFVAFAIYALAGANSAWALSHPA